MADQTETAAVKVAYFKKDYLAVGKILKDHKTDQKMVDAFAELFRHDNPQFDEQRFRDFVAGTRNSSVAEIRAMLKKAAEADDADLERWYGQNVKQEKESVEKTTGIEAPTEPQNAVTAAQEPVVEPSKEETAKQSSDQPATDDQNVVLARQLVALAESMLKQ